MLKSVLFVATLLLMSCGTTTYYVVRHAEKAAPTSNMTSDVPLSEEGKQRAEALAELLKRKVSFVTSTNTLRTRQTAEPLAAAIGRSVHVYDHRDTALLQRYRNEKTDMLLVGHSNTVDDIINFLMGDNVMQDLPDTAYGDLFIVKKKGKRFSFERQHFGK